ncbi:MAG: Gfo/Idh/MocA family oxidoreductase [Bacteroidales bacterium]|nr:Gfo/Idh/MocA family oxidoreductase [Bacteroidales bacterium]
MKSHNFALIGAAGYIAPRHFRAIKENNQNLVAVLDKSDSVGTIDSFFPDADLFLEPERFDRHIYKLSKEADQKVDFFSICSPNYLHDSHIRLALRNGADAICEKPLVLNPWNLEGLRNVEKETGKKVYHILQLRLHPSILQLAEKVRKGPQDKVYDIDLTYITGRGHWYFYSWKGDVSKSGGITTNIGTHFFDMLLHIFGEVEESVVHKNTPEVAAGFLRLKQARVRWFLSVNADFVPAEWRAQGKRTFRSININGEEFEFSDGFTDLHTLSYQKILTGQGFTLDEAEPYVQLCQRIRTSETAELMGDYHPFLKML